MDQAKIAMHVGLGGIILATFLPWAEISFTFGSSSFAAGADGFEVGDGKLSLGMAIIASVVVLSGRNEWAPFVVIAICACITALGIYNVIEPFGLGDQIPNSIASNPLGFEARPQAGAYLAVIGAIFAGGGALVRCIDNLKTAPPLIAEPPATISQDMPDSW